LSMPRMAKELASRTGRNDSIRLSAASTDSMSPIKRLITSNANERSVCASASSLSHIPRRCNLTASRIPLLEDRQMPIDRAPMLPSITKPYSEETACTTRISSSSFRVNINHYYYY
jgi:hypothetical protein